MRNIISLVVCAAIIAGGALFGMAYMRYHGDQENVAEATLVEEPTLVELRVLESQQLPDELILTGRLVPWVEITLSAEVRGNIEAQTVEAGARVTTGQELFRIDTSSLETTFDQARSRYDLAAQELRRIEDLQANGISSPQSLDRARTDRDVAKADLAAARDALEKSVVVSPGDGVVQTLHKRQTEFADIGTPLIHLAQVDRLRAAVGMPERDVAHFQVGDSVAVYIDALGKTVVRGNIISIGAAADITTRTFLVEVGLDNTEELLRPGMTIRAHFIREIYDNAVVVPLFAVLTMENQRYVMIEEALVARRRQVEVGRILGETVHITTGLVPGDRLIVRGQRDLRDGAPVQVRSE